MNPIDNAPKIVTTDKIEVYTKDKGYYAIINKGSIDNPKRSPIVVFRNGQCEINDTQIIKVSELKNRGIPIPPMCEEEFGDRDFVRLGEEGFEDAFRRFYFPARMDPSKYVWMKEVNPAEENVVKPMEQIKPIENP